MPRTYSSTVGHWYLTRRFSILFYSILATLALGPLLAGIGIPRESFTVLIALNLAFALYASDNRLLIYCLFPLTLVIVSELANILVVKEESIPLIGSPVVIALTFAAALNTFFHSVRCREVDAECIYAALDAYLLAGICLSFTYWLVNQIEPGSFFMSGAPSTATLPVSTLLYFSFITLTTTGYGDVLPVSNVARGLAVAEAVVGQLYLASMLARLVSVYSQRQHDT